MKTSESTKGINAALAAAQGEMGRVVKDKTAKVQMKSGGSYSFDYADLASVLDVVRPSLAKHGIAVIQTAALDAGQVIVETRLAHASGEWIESALAVKPEDVAPQKIGSAITYARRYALSCMVGVASEEDDDGNAAEGNHAQTVRLERPRLAPRASPAQHPNIPVAAAVLGGTVVRPTTASELWDEAGREWGEKGRKPKWDAARLEVFGATPPPMAEWTPEQTAKVEAILFPPPPPAGTQGVPF